MIDAEKIEKLLSTTNEAELWKVIKGLSELEAKTLLKVFVLDSNKRHIVPINDGKVS